MDDSLSYTDEYLKGRKIGECEFKQVSRPYVRRIIKNLSNTGAIGRDGISTAVLKRYTNVLTGPITHVINLCIYHSQYPDNWKLGTITPLPKGGKKTDPKNWRPICINSSMSKILETVINNQISSYMEQSGLYSRTQHAYRSVRSVTTALLELDTIVKDRLNMGETVAILTTDISAGFNLVSREILIPKMQRFGFTESSCDLLDNYLTGRRTRVKIKGIMSPEIGLDTGVGEGSVLGPNFFSCGMTDISVVSSRVKEHLKSFYKIDAFVTQIEYADDTTGLISCSTERELQIAIDELLQGFSRFYSANGLKLNESKCHVLVIRPGIKTLTLTCAGKEEEDNLRLLGLFIDNKLDYKFHTEKVRGRLIGKLQQLEKLKGKASFKTLKEVTQSLIHSTIEFVAEIYLRNPPNQVRIQKQLNSVMRVLLDKDWETSCELMMSQLDWLNVQNMWHWCSIRTLKRVVSWPPQAPHLYEKWDQNEDPERPLRYNGLKVTWRKQTRWAHESFAMTSVKVYNQINLHGRLFPTYEEMRDSVKSSIRNYFGNKNLY